jgi:hypothetical protein
VPRVRAIWQFRLFRSTFTDEYSAFLQRLIAACKTAAVTQQELAVRLGKPQSFVSKYERRGRRLDIVEFVIIDITIGLDPSGVIELEVKK